MTTSKNFRRLLGLIVLSGGAAASAQVSETVVITANRDLRTFDTPYAVGVVEADALRSAGPMVNLSEALGRLPGLVVNLRGNYAQDLQINSRGFGARASFGVRGIRLYADGIPATGPDGQGQVSHFDIAGASRIEVLRGPFSALYGNGSGGVIALVSRAPVERSAWIDADAGSAGLRQVRLGVAAPFEGGFSLRASVAGFEIEGFRPRSGARRTLGNVRLGWDGARDRVLVVLNAIDQPAQDPLGLTRAQFDADPDQTAPQSSQFDTRKTTAQMQAGLTWEHDFGDAGPLQRGTVAVFSGQRAVTQWQAIPPATQANPRHPGGVIDFDRDYAGVDARLYFAWDAVRLVTGLASDTQREDRRGYENFVGTPPTQALGVTGALRRDEDNKATSTDVYAQAEVDLGRELTAVIGGRQGRLRVTSSDRYLSNGDDSGRLTFRYSNPVAALRWQPLADWTFHVSVGRGYESPTLNELAYRPDGNPGFNAALEAQRSRQLEVGARWRDSSRGLALDIALFRADTQNEIGIQTNSGGRSTFANVGRTRRQGAEFDLRWRIAPQWRAQLAATVLHTAYRDGFLTCAGVPCAAPTVPVRAGNRIAGTLPRAAYAEVSWTRPTTEMALEASARGKLPVNDVNSDFAAGYGLLALRAVWKVPLGAGRLELLGRVDNLADRRVAGSVIVNETNQRYFEPAAGRNYLLSARWNQPF
jgi:iron complex outermembrane receptor protein